MINNNKNIIPKTKAHSGSSPYGTATPIQPTLKPVSIEPLTQLPQTPLESAPTPVTYTTAAAAAAAAAAALSSPTATAPATLPTLFSPSAKAHFASPAELAPFQPPGTAAAAAAGSSGMGAPYGGLSQVPPALPQQRFCDGGMAGTTTTTTSPEVSLESKLAVLNALSASVGINMTGSAQRLHHGHHRSALCQAAQQGRALSPQEFASTLSALSSIANSLPRSTAMSEELQHTGALSNNVVVANKISNGSSPLK